MTVSVHIPEPTLKDRLWKAKIDGKGEPEMASETVDSDSL